MNKNFKVAITLLMAILILILIWVLVKYYKADPFTAVTSTTVDTPINEDNSSISIENNSSIVIEQNDNEIIENVEIKDELDENSAIEDENNQEEKKQEELPTKPINQPKEPVVISSSENTSNAEKQEVLNEIDKALMELLQVVDKVQGVDETRLGIDESEVQ